MKAIFRGALALAALSSLLSAGTVHVTLSLAAKAPVSASSKKIYGDDYAKPLSNARENFSTIMTNGTAGVQGRAHIFAVTVAQSPEPASLALMGIGMVGLSIFGRRKFFPTRKLAAARV